MHLSPELVDTVADYMAIFVLFFVPALLIYVFWMVHILPEKIAERRGHPQAEAIKTLCLLSLVFGGLLWPIAWLWAYSKPVLYKMAYGTDTVVHPSGDGHAAPTDSVPPVEQPALVSGQMPTLAPVPRSGSDLAPINSLPGEH